MHVISSDVYDVDGELGSGPLRVVLIYKGQGHVWVAECEWLEVYGSGTSAAFAVKDIHESIDYFRAYYARLGDEQLTEFARRLRDRFALLRLKPPEFEG